MVGNPAFQGACLEAVTRLKTARTDEVRAYVERKMECKVLMDHIRKVLTKAARRGVIGRERRGNRGTTRIIWYAPPVHLKGWGW